MTIAPLKLKGDESLCQSLCVEDCRHARENLFNKDKWRVENVAGKCPKDCPICLYPERYKRNDANWIPQPNDPQYKHWSER